jgi:hypothetical protein
VLNVTFRQAILWLHKMVNGLTHNRSREGGLGRTFFSCSLGKKLKENKNKEAKEFVLPRCFIYFSFGLKRSCQLFFQPFYDGLARPDGVQLGPGALFVLLREQAPALGVHLSV